MQLARDKGKGNVKDFFEARLFKGTAAGDMGQV